MRQRVITALAEISNNIGLGEEYSLENELAEAVSLCYQARKDGFKDGERVSGFARQTVLFADEESATVADYRNATIMMLADVLNDTRTSQLKKTLAVYNSAAKDAADGQMDIFSGGVKDKEQILKDVLEILNYGTEEQQSAALTGAVERRKAKSVQQNGTDEQGGERNGSTRPNSKNKEERVQPLTADKNAIVGRSLSTDEAEHLIAWMEEKATVAPELELTPANWEAQFGEDGRVVTPIAEVKMGDNQYLKIAQQGRNGKLGMVKPTLEHPAVIIEDERPASDGKEERPSAYVFVKTFAKKDGSRYYHFTSVTVSKDGLEVVISNQEKSANRISTLLQQGKVAWIDSGFSLHPTTQIKESVPLNETNKPTTTDSQPALLGINSPEPNVHSEVHTVPAVGESTSTDTSEVDSSQIEGATAPAGNSLNTSDGKVTESSDNAQEKRKKVVFPPADTMQAEQKPQPKEGESPIEYAVRVAEWQNVKGCIDAGVAYSGEFDSLKQRIKEIDREDDEGKDIAEQEKERNARLTELYADYRAKHGESGRMAAYREAANKVFEDYYQKAKANIEAQDIEKQMREVDDKILRGNIEMWENAEENADGVVDKDIARFITGEYREPSINRGLINTLIGDEAILKAKRDTLLERAKAELARRKQKNSYRSGRVATPVGNKADELLWKYDTAQTAEEKAAAVEALKGFDIAGEIAEREEGLKHLAEKKAQAEKEAAKKRKAAEAHNKQTREKADEAESEPEGERELRSRYEGSHSPFGFVWQIASATGWSVDYILHGVNYQTLIMMLSDAPRYKRAKSGGKVNGESAEDEAKEIIGFYQSKLS